MPVKGWEYFWVVMVFKKYHLKNAANAHLHFFFISERVATVLVVLKTDSPFLNVLIHDRTFH